MSAIVLRERDWATLRGIFRRHPAIREVRLFGSRAGGSVRRVSDIDLAVVAPEMSAGEWVELKGELDDAPIVYEIDTVRLDQLADGSFKEKIERTSVRLYE